MGAADVGAAAAGRTAGRAGVGEQLWRAVAVYRLAALGYAAVLVATNAHNYARPALGWALLGVMAGWTVAVTAFYAVPSRRSPGLLAADVALGAGLVLATIAVETPARIASDAPTLPAVWPAAAVLAVAVAAGPWWGTAAAGVVSIADVVERGAMTEHTFNGVVLLLIAGGVGGYVVRLAVRAEQTIAAAARREAAAGERERLARDIHDSVLQVLALVARRGAALGGEAADLARLAAEQEVALRALVTAPPAAIDDIGAVDLRSLLAPLGSDRVTVSCPAQPVPLPEHVARDLAAAVGEALGNVRRHAGAAARAWLLVEDEDDAVTVTVRDDGAGIPDGRLDAARRDGRIGVAQSILGRVADLGGQATLTSSPGAGTEVELRVPRPR